MDLHIVIIYMHGMGQDLFEPMWPIFIERERYTDLCICVCV